jgi:mycofactocin precursor peptide peptidase
MSIALAEVAWPDVPAVSSSMVLVVPVGATEQHGPHLPLGTDTAIAVGLAEGLSWKRDDIVVAPPLSYGASGEHAQFPGTLSIGQQAIELALIELGRSASATFDRVLLISTHGGNIEPVRRALRQLRHEGRDVRGFFPSWSRDAHAGRTETSLMLALAPRRVRLERAGPGATAPLRELLPTIRARGVRDVSATGVLGDPAGASAQEGWTMLRGAVRQLSTLVDSWESRT